MDCHTFILHYLIEFAQTHVHWVRDAIQPSPTSPSSCLQSFPASGSFPMCWFLALGGQSTGTSASASVLPMNIQSRFTLGLTGLISLMSKGLSRVFSSTKIQKHQSFSSQLSLGSNSHICTWLPEKLQLWLYRLFVSKVVSLLFNTLFRFVIAFLPRSKSLLSIFHGSSHHLQWFWSPRK